jgi:type IV pilus assembly protein PilV
MIGTGTFPARRQGGLTLVEVLVTVIVLLIGLLGMATLLASSERAEAEAYQRAQALLLLQDMVARINSNRSVAVCYAITTDQTSGSPYMGAGSSAPPACGAGTVVANSLANQDLTDWNALLVGATETLGGNNVGTLTGARGCVTVDPTNSRLYTVSVAWQGLNQTAAPDATLTCGKDQYGDEKQRRVVSVLVQIANLS